MSGIYRVWSGGVHLDLRCGQVVGEIESKVWPGGECGWT